MINYNIVYFIIFTGTFAMSIFRIKTVNPKIVISCRYINPNNAVFLFIGLFGLGTLFINNSLIDIARSFVMFIAILSYTFIKSGLGNDGIYNNGIFYSFKEISGYEVNEGKNTLKVKYKTLNNSKGFNGYLLFDISKKYCVAEFLNNKLPKKNFSEKN